MRWLRPPPAATAAFSSDRSPGVVLRVSRIVARLPLTASTKRAVSVATPDRWQSRLSAVRSAASSARAGPLASATSAGHRVAPLALRLRARSKLSRPRLGEGLGGDLEPEHDARLLLHDPRPAPASAGTTASEVTSPGAEVLGQRAGDEIAQLAAICASAHSAANTAIVAVKPCRKLRPPTGPISPAQKKPPAGTPSASSTAVASWSGTSNMCAPRPLQVNSSAPAGPGGAERLRLRAERVAQVLVGRGAVADVHADGLADPDALADRDRARLARRRR